MKLSELNQRAAELSGEIAKLNAEGATIRDEQSAASYLQRITKLQGELQYTEEQINEFN